MSRLEELQNIFSGIDDDKRTVIAPLIVQAVDREDEISIYTATLNSITLSKKTKDQYLTLSKLKREAQQQYCNIIKTLLITLYRTESSAADDLLAKLSEFES